MQQVLSEALLFCCSAQNDLTEHVRGSDDYISLKVLADSIIQLDIFDLYYAFGTICALFLIKMHSAPEPVYSALIQAAIGEVDSILDSD